MIINIVIRTSYRPKAFQRCIDSIMSQELPIGVGINIVVGYDDDRALDYISDYFHTVCCLGLGHKDSTHPYNEYLNTLINHNRITMGHILVLDDDDELALGALRKLVSVVKQGYSYIFPLLKPNGIQKPFPNMIAAKAIHRGYIGMPCLFLAVNHRHLVHFDGTEYADFNVINNLSKEINLHWSNLILVNVSERGNGQNEK